MRRIAVVLVTVATVVPASPAVAAPLRGCGVISGYRVAADAQSTTCGLARSATRNFIRKLGQGFGTPTRIVGRSPKTGRLYGFGLARTTRTQTTSSSLYKGRAGAAVLRVRISSSIF
jgi:hypothetical protein